MDSRPTTGLPPTGQTGPPDAEESALLAGLRSGSADAFERVVRLYSGRLFAVARRMVSDEEEARDALQDAFLSAFRGIQGFEGGSRLSTWLHRIAVNAALMRMRARGRRRKNERPITDLLPRFKEDGHQDEPAAEWHEPSGAAMERRETRALVQRCIDELPEAYRTVLLLRDIEGVDTDMTANLLELSPAAVKTRLHRARQALRALLDPHMRGSAEAPPPKGSHTLTCRELIDFISDYLEGDLPAAQRGAFEGHLAVCPPCVAYLKTFKETINISRSALAGLDAAATEPAPEDLIRAVLAARSAKPTR